MQFTSQFGDLTGATVKLQARIDTSSRYAIIDVDGALVDASKGIYSVTFPSSITLGKGQDKAYYYDIKIQKADKTVHTDRSGMLTVDPRTTDLNAQPVITTSGVDIQNNGVMVKADAAHINLIGDMNVSEDGDGVSIGANSIKSGSYSAGTLTLTKEDGSTFDVSGWRDLSGLDFSEDGSDVGVFSKVDFKGNAVNAVKNDETLEVTINRAAVAPTLALQFSGIYDTLQDLKDAIPSPTSNQQAIVLQPSEKYYHGVGGSWVELAPVGSFHPNYLGAYDTVQDLESAEPSPANESLAIVGTTAKSFYIYTSSQWEQVTHTDLPSLDARVTDNEAKTKDNIKRLDVAEGHLQSLQLKDQQHDQQFSAIGDDITQLQARPQGIELENADGSKLSDLTSLKLNGSQIIDNGDGTYTLKTASQISVANGQQPGSTEVDASALVFTGATISVDPNDSKVAHITVPTVGTSEISVGDGVNASRDVNTIIFNGHTAYGSGNTAEIHLEFAHFKTISERDEWTTKFGSKMNFDVVCLVDSDDNGFVAWYRFDAATKAWKDYDAQGVVMSDSNGAIPKNIKTVVFGPGFSIQQAGDQEDAALVTFTESSGIDGIEINGSKLTEFNTAPPLQFDDGLHTGSDPVMLIDPRAYEVQHAASCLLQLDSDLTLQVGRETKLYTSHEIIPTGEYFSLNQQHGGVNVQDNTGGDTSVTGGELTRIIGSVSFYGKATADSNVKIWFEYKDPASPLPASILMDVNGHPMIVERNYNSGDELSEPLVIAGAMMATGQAPVVLKVEVSAGSYVVNPDQTLICVEQFSDGYETGIASIEFQRRLGIELHAEIKSFTSKMLSMKSELTGQSVPEGVISANQGYDFLNEFGVQNLTEVKASISGDMLNISDNGGVTDFYVDIYIDNVKTAMLRGKEIDYDVVIKNPRDAYNLEVYKWTGKPDSAGAIYSSRNNESLNLNAGFELVKSKFIAEHPAGDASGVTDTVTVPDDAKNLFIILRPVQAQSPISLSLIEFSWGVSDPFRGYLETSRVNLREQHLWFSESWAEFGLNSHDIGAAGLRYTISNTPSSGNPMPVGKLYKGRAPVEIDNSVNKVSGSDEPQMDGAIKFLKDGEADISKSYNVWNEQGTENTVTFWDVLIDADGNESKIPDSERIFKVPANTGAPGVIYSIPAYTIQVETGQRIGGRALSNKAGGAYVQSQNITELIVLTTIDFREEVATNYDSPDLISAPIPKALITDRRVYSFSGNSQQNVVINLDIPADVELSEIEVVKHSGTITTSIKDCEYAYDSSTKKLTVHVGNGVSEGKVYLTFWSGVS